MEAPSKKRTLDSFFVPAAEEARPAGDSSGAAVGEAASTRATTHDATPINFSAHHHTYPFPIPHLPISISSALSSMPSTIGKVINDQADLDLLYFQPYIPKHLERQLSEFLQSQLPFYCVEYKIKRGNIETQIRTPRCTTVFGLDETSSFDEAGQVVDARTHTPIQQKNKHYAKYALSPIPSCLNALCLSTEAATGCQFNFCLANYYASGTDSISYHSDDERFLGALPSIASFSLGSKRGFLMKYKPFPQHDNNLSSGQPPELRCSNSH